jgi:exodeoxyribonuclease I
VSDSTFFWHDYETFGTDTQRDRPCQFAGIRTDVDFNVVGEPLVVYCKPSADYLPDPYACLVTGITPQLAAEKGVCEAEFIRVIHEQMAVPGTCTVGYNNIRFDDEVTRNTLYRNFYDPYAREWQNQNSRWDIIDVARAAQALRPEGITWPLNEDGWPSFRLEELTQANGIEHGSAHDALSDVYATIAFARLLRDKQPKLFNYLYTQRQKQPVQKLLQKPGNQPLVHVSGMYSAQQQRLAVVLPLCEHPSNSNGVIVYDLSEDPKSLLELNAENIRLRIFTAASELPDDVTRIPLKTVHVNKCPVLAPINVLRAQDRERLNIDLDKCYSHRDQILADQGLAHKVAEVFSQQYNAETSDPDLMLYSGGFFSPHDRSQMNKIRVAPVATLTGIQPKFQDQRLPEMWFRYRARNYPQCLNKSESQAWYEHCRAVLNEVDVCCHYSLKTFLNELKLLQVSTPEHNTLLLKLQEFALHKAKEFDLELPAD